MAVGANARNRVIRNFIPSAARTATTNFEDQTNRDHRGVRVRISVTAVTSTPSTTFTLQGKNPAGAYETILSSAAVATVSEVVLTAYPGLTAAANVAANAVLPSKWRVIATHGNANSMTYSATAELLV